MDIEKEDGFMSDTQFKFGFDSQDNPRVMMLNIPIEMCASDLPNGTALLRGKFEEAKQVALNLISKRRAQKPKPLEVLQPYVS